MPSKLLPFVAIATLAASDVHAVLYAVDTSPLLHSNGFFAAWYQDTHGRTLDLCLSKAVSSRSPGTPASPGYMCTLLTAPDVFDDTLPIDFPSNFPDEAFWFTADAEIIDAASGIDLRYVAALEAAFNVELPKDGDQVSFARIRIRADVPAPGIYTVTHPYGSEILEVPAGGDLEIRMNRDIGIGAPKVYTGALGGDIGPFLRSVNGPYVETNPQTLAQESFIGDPNLEEEVTGSPYGTNYVRIEGPNGIDLRTTLFAISGKLSEQSLPTPLIPQRASYSRQAGSEGVVAQQDVFALAPPPPGSLSFTDTAGDAVQMRESTATGNWYGQSAANPTLPANLTLTADNAAAIPNSTPTSVTVPLTDQVQIVRAEYGLSSGQLTVQASSSDQTGQPTLTVSFDHGAPIGTLAGGTVKSLTTGVSPIPPARVRVTSSNGGSDLEEVVLLP